MKLFFFLFSGIALAVLSGGCVSWFGPSEAELLYAKATNAEALKKVDSLSITYSAKTVDRIVLDLKRPDMLQMAFYEDGNKKPIEIVAMSGGVVRRNGHVIEDPALQKALSFTYALYMNPLDLYETLGIAEDAELREIPCVKLILMPKAQYASGPVQVFIAKNTQYCLRIAVTEQNGVAFTDDFYDFKDFSGIIFPLKTVTVQPGIMDEYRLESVEVNSKLPPDMPSQKR